MATYVQAIKLEEIVFKPIKHLKCVYTINYEHVAKA